MLLPYFFTVEPQLLFFYRKFLQIFFYSVYSLGQTI